MIFAEVLYHELAHHRHFMLRSNPASVESEAGKVTAKLFRKFIQEQYWYLVPIFYVASAIDWLVRKSVRLLRGSGNM